MINADRLIQTIMLHDYFPCTIDENSNNVVMQIIDIIRKLDNEPTNII